MAFDPNNPFAIPDPFGMTPAPKPPTAPLPPLTEEEKQSLLEKIGSAGLGGLSYLAGALNKPGRAIRGLLGGTPREALNLIPFSDALGITDPTQEVRGTDLIGAPKDTSLLSPEGVAGLGVDVLTDPLTYLSFGGSALTKAGLAAKRAGTLPATVAERAARGLGGHVGVGLPFAGNQATFNLAPAAQAIGSGIRALPGGNAVADLAGGIGSAVGDFYNRTIPPLFQKSVMGQTSPEAQAAARAASQALPGAQAAARGEVGAINQLLPDVAAGLTPEAATAARMEQARQLRQGLEMIGQPAGPLAPAIEQQRALQSSNLSQLNQLGHPDLPLTDPGIGYAPREATLPMAREPGGFGQSLKPAGQRPAREEILKGLPTEGPASINDLTRRKDILPLRDAYNSGQTAPLVDLVKKDYLKVDEAELEGLRQQMASYQRGTGAGGPPDAARLAELEAKSKQAENLADWVATSVPKELAENNLGFFERHPHLDLETKHVKDTERILKTKALHESIAGMARLGEEGVPLSEVLNRAGLTYKDAAGNPTAMSRTLEAMQAQGKLGPSASLADMADWTIPFDQVDRVAKFTKAATSPAGLRPFLQLFDSVTNLTKAFQTTLWPANWARNQGQALFQNWVHDAYNAQAAGPMKYVKPLVDAKAWREGQTIEGASAYPGLQHLSDEGATKVLQSEIKNYNIATAFKNPEADIVGGELTTRRLLPETLGEPRKPFKQILSEYVPKSLEEAKPWNVAGVGGRIEDVTSYIKSGRELNQEMHAMDRVAAYLAKRSQGYAPEAAMNEMKLAHFDYANMTGFEKDVMKRVIPFYNFARQNIPAVVTELGKNPGGKLAQTIKAVNELKGQHPGFIPSYVGEGVAAPIGAEEDGTQRYLTHLGLGFEDIGRLTGPGGPLGLLNPLIKAPIEQATGRQLFAGRDLSDLHSRLGDLTGAPLPLAENLLMNSPAGRAISTAGTWADSRKSLLDKILNTTTGTRVSDVNVDQARRNAVRDYAQSLLRGPGVSHFEELAVKPENLPLLSPLEQQLYQLYRSQQGRRPAPLTFGQ